jgi:hypothetical protein
MVAGHVIGMAADRSLPTCVRARLGLLLAYLAFPLDIVPDFVPVLGYADDATIRSSPRGRSQVKPRPQWSGRGPDRSSGD